MTLGRTERQPYGTIAGLVEQYDMFTCLAGALRRVEPLPSPERSTSLPATDVIRLSLAAVTFSKGFIAL